MNFFIEITLCLALTQERERDRHQPAPKQPAQAHDCRVCLPASRVLPPACRGKARGTSGRERESGEGTEFHRKNSTDASLSKVQRHMRSLTSFLNNSSIIEI